MIGRVVLDQRQVEGILRCFKRRQVQWQDLFLDHDVKLELRLDDVGWYLSHHLLQCDVTFQSLIKILFKKGLAHGESGQVERFETLIDGKCFTQRDKTALICHFFVLCNVQEINAIVVSEGFCECVKA